MKEKVSICCLCYNHEKYIRNALNSFISQRKNFELEIIIFDDQSTDNSREILESYRDKYPNIIRLMYPQENIYSKGRTAFFDIIQEADGQYLAFCEGDDYWCDPEKLISQYEFMVNNKDIGICFHPALTLNIDGEVKDLGYGHYGKKIDIHPFKNILEVSGGYMAMASIFARKSKFEELFSMNPEFFSKETWHSTIQLVASYPHGAGYLPKAMCVYRSLHEGSWSHNMNSSYEAVIEDYTRFLVRNKKLRKYFCNSYDHVFEEVKKRRIGKIISHKDISLREKFSLYKRSNNKFEFMYVIKLLVIAFSTRVLGFVKK